MFLYIVWTRGFLSMYVVSIVFFIVCLLACLLAWPCVLIHPFVFFAGIATVL